MEEEYQEEAEKAQEKCEEENTVTIGMYTYVGINICGRLHIKSIPNGWNKCSIGGNGLSILKA